MKEERGVLFILKYMIAGAIIGLMFVALIEPKYPQAGDIALSHEEAEEMCEKLDMVYDYEAEGYTTADFCIKVEDMKEDTDD